MPGEVSTPKQVKPRAKGGRVVRPRGAPRVEPLPLTTVDSLMASPEVLGRRVRAARMEQGMTQRDLAQGEFDPSYISYLEAGKTQPSLDSLSKLAARLGKTLMYFLSPEDISAVTVRPQPRQELLFAELALERGTPDEAEAFLKKLNIKELSGLAKVHLAYLLSRLASQQEDTLRARQYIQDGLSLSTEIGNPYYLPALYALNGDTYIQDKDYTLAVESHRHAWQITEEALFNDPTPKLAILYSLANDYIQLNDQRQALLYLEQAIELGNKTIHLHQQADTYLKIARQLHLTKEDELAEEYTRRSLEIGRQAQNNVYLAQATSKMADLLAGTGDLDKASALCERAVEITAQTGDTVRLAFAFAALADILRQQNRREEAGVAVRRAMEYATDHGDVAAIGRAWFARAQIEQDVSSRQTIERSYQEAIRLLEEAKTTDFLGKAYFAYARALREWGDAATALEFMEKAYSLK